MKDTKITKTLAHLVTLSPCHHVIFRALRVLRGDPEASGFVWRGQGLGRARLAVIRQSHPCTRGRAMPSIRLTTRQVRGMILLAT